MPEADEDYFAIYLRGMELFGNEKAERYADGLDRTFEFVSDYPRAARQRIEIDPPVRAYPTKSHVIVYQVGTDGLVLILRLRHASEDRQANPI